MQLLVQAEQRLATQQRYNVEVAEKEISVRGRLAQVDIELDQLDRTYPSNIEGSTRTPEIREVSAPHYGGKNHASKWTAADSGSINRCTEQRA